MRSYCIAAAKAEAGIANRPVYASGKADYIVLIVRVKEPFMFYFVCELCSVQAGTATVAEPILNLKCSCLLLKRLMMFMA